MKFPNVIRRGELIQAAILGSATGVVGVLFFIILLNSMNTEQATNEVIPVQGNENTTIVESGEEFFANQHGMFSSFEAASEFTAGYPSLNTSAIVEIDKKFYVWSSISPTKEGIVKTENPTSFAKAFTFSGAGCTNKTLQNLPTLLKSNDRSKFYFEEGKVPENLPKDWQSITTALSSLSDDLAVVRLHLLTHYFSKNDCMKIKF